MRALLAMALVAGCSASAPNGFGVDLTVRAGSSVDRSQVATLSFGVSGDETFAKTMDGAPLRNGDFHVRYVPGIASGTLDFAVDALAAGGTILGSGDTGPVTLNPGHAVAATLTLGGSGDDMTTSDLAGSDMMSTDFANADFAGCVPTMTTCPASVACGKISDGCGGILDCGAPCLLAAMDPTVAKTGDTITFEGTFSIDATVDFPGGVSKPATLLSSHRATVVVPSGATAGPLTVTTGMSTLGPLPFRNGPGTPGLLAFRANYEQPEGARQMPPLVTPRWGAPGIVIGSYLYVIGGFDGSAGTATIERATINADGSLGGFSIVLGVTLTTPRQYASAVVVGNYLYVLGGVGGSGALASVERAPINADGTLQNFGLVPGVTLIGPSSGQSINVIGNSLYVIGGQNTMTTGAVQRATINPDGSISTFALVSGVVLTTPRAGHTSDIVGSSLYVVGGAPSGGVTGTVSVERATINADGTLANFVNAGTVANARTTHQSAVIDGALYVLGGVNGMSGITFQATPSVEKGTVGAGGVLTFTNLPVSLTTARFGHAAVVIDGSLYVVGGENAGGGPTGTTERASINGSGSLGSLATVTGVSLVTPRYAHTTLVAGRSLYVVGGNNGATVGTVERALINADDTLATFATVAGTVLATARYEFAGAVAGPYYYAIGGESGGTDQGSVDRALIGPDGALSTFANVSSTNLATPRYGHCAVVVGNFIYVIGGQHVTFLPSVEQATINADGTLSTFTTVAGVTLQNPRMFHTCAVLGNTLYVFGGFGVVAGNNAPLASIETAAINSSNALSTFSTASIALTTPRFQHSTVKVGGQLYPFAGYNNGPLASFESSSDPPSSFSTNSILNLVAPRYAQTSVPIGRWLYVIGGFGASAPIGSVERAAIP